MAKLYHLYQLLNFRKEGFPMFIKYTHYLKESKIKTPAQINKFISAEIPDPNINPVLYDIVMKNMIHGPCADWCLVDGKCSKKFSKRFQDETVIDGNSYPLYRRRNFGYKHKKDNGYEVDNQYVVPYNPTLLLQFNCHINVEVCSSIQSIKYIHKYIYKGHDSASAVISNKNNGSNEINHDEITHFVDSRYVGPSEAIWRILSKPLQEKSHSVVRLPVHLPNFQNITLHTDPFEDEINSALDQVSMLINYFTLNETDSNARQYYYSEIPMHYIYKKQKLDGKTVTQWCRRKLKINVIGRMYAVNPSQIELFRLRILLLRVKGATSFEDLKTVNGNIQETFTAACLAHGFIENGQKWSQAMNEASLYMMPKQIRNVFVRILIHCNPLKTEQLWADYKEAMSVDFRRNNNVDDSLAKAVSDIERSLNGEDKSLADYPQLRNLLLLINNRTFSLEEQTVQNYLTLGQSRLARMNLKQRDITNRILNSVLQKGNSTDLENCFFIDGPGGSGKTFVYQTLYYILKGHDKKVCTMAFTGIAATLLPEGKTVHKVFKLPVPLLPDSSSNIELGTNEAQELKEIRCQLHWQ